MPKGYPNSGIRSEYKSAKNLARGTKEGRYLKGWFALDPTTFNEIRDLAEYNDCSFSEQLRVLIEWGLLEWKINGDN